MDVKTIILQNNFLIKCNSIAVNRDPFKHTSNWVIIPCSHINLNPSPNPKPAFYLSCFLLDLGLGLKFNFAY